ncbi:MAG: phage tail protein, partial [Methanobrevibacter sp.]|nr:phage tail protein [Methanobrevibacter sp.]
MILYEEGTTNFTRNGLGYINDVLSAKVVDELNGEYSLTFEYPTLGVMSDKLLEGRIVKCNVSDGTQQCFIIKNIVKTYDKMTITCSHLFYLLLDDLAEDIYPQNLSPKPFLDWILTRANYQLPFQTTSDVSIQRTGRYVRRNLVDVIVGEEKNSMVNLFGIELKRNNFNIALNSRIGADRGEKLIYGKNITGINITTDANSVYTRIMPVGFDGLLLPEKYIDADNIDDYPYPKIGIFEFSDIRYDPDDETAYHDINDAYEALRNAVEELYDNGVNLPKVNIKIDWLELSKTEEYKQYSTLERVELGDTIHAEIFGLNYTTRVIKTTYNPLNDRVEQFEIGTFQPSIATQMNRYEIDLQTINPASILEEAKDNATNLITNAMGGYVYKTNDELYIMDNEDPNQAVHVWRWNINGLGY